MNIADIQGIIFIDMWELPIDAKSIRLDQNCKKLPTIKNKIIATYNVNEPFDISRKNSSCQAEFFGVSKYV